MRGWQSRQVVSRTIALMHGAAARIQALHRGHALRLRRWLATQTWAMWSTLRDVRKRELWRRVSSTMRWRVHRCTHAPCRSAWLQRQVGRRLKGAQVNAVRVVHKRRHAEFVIAVGLSRWWRAHKAQRRDQLRTGTQRRAAALIYSAWWRVRWLRVRRRAADRREYRAQVRGCCKWHWRDGQ